MENNNAKLEINGAVTLISAQALMQYVDILAFGCMSGR